MARFSEKFLRKSIDFVKIAVGDIYYHYKDLSASKPYKIITLAVDESTEKISIVYEAQYGEKIRWIRTLDNFTELVDDTTGQIPRFRR